MALLLATIVLLLPGIISACSPILTCQQVQQLAAANFPAQYQTGSSFLHASPNNKLAHCRRYDMHCVLRKVRFFHMNWIQTSGILVRFLDISTPFFPLSLLEQSPHRLICGSSWCPNAYNGICCYGLWQINKNQYVILVLISSSQQNPIYFLSNPCLLGFVLSGRYVTVHKNQQTDY
jgi:hypothetical protein